MTELIIDLSLFIGTLVLAAYFAFLETSFTGLRLYQVKELHHKLSSYKHFFAVWTTAPQRILTAILVANNFFSILCSVLIARAMEESLGDIGVAVGVAVATVLILLFGDIVPKTFAKMHHGSLFNRSIWLLNGLLRAMEPVVSLLLYAAKVILKILGVDNAGKMASGEVSEKEIEFLIGYGDEKGVIEAEKSELLQNVFGLGQTMVQEIMVPWSDMIRFDVEKPMDEAKAFLIKHRYSRLPVYRGREDNIVGMVYHKDIYGLESAKKTLVDLMRPVMFVPESKKANQLLKEFLKKRMHLAIVVDEHGGVTGMATLEDVLEEIVGEIRDEHEKELPGVVLLKKGGWLINAGMPLEDVGDLLEIEFEVENSITLAGFMMEGLQRLPSVGDKLSYKGYVFQVSEASLKRVFQVKVLKENPTDLSKK